MWTKFLEPDELLDNPCDSGLARAEKGVYDPADLARVIMNWKNPETISPELLIELLADDNYEVRSACASALGKLGDHSSIPALTLALGSDKNCFVRGACAWALGKIKEKLAKEGAVE